MHCAACEVFEEAHSWVTTLENLCTPQCEDVGLVVGGGTNQVFFARRDGHPYYGSVVLFNLVLLSGSALVPLTVSRLVEDSHDTGCASTDKTFGK
mmetsp:Transcript_16448/g.19454  ORF Transcript_16448/g.19454 Transcript_16448/m.19454 type:complete len:95 (-) Transcript_16448:983-1267(-)